MVSPTERGEWATYLDNVTRAHTFLGPGLGVKVCRRSRGCDHWAKWIRGGGFAHPNRTKNHTNTNGVKCVQAKSHRNRPPPDE